MNETCKHTRYINLFGGPCCGKSTTAAGLFYEMKRRGLDVELVTEYPKELAWDGRLSELACQFKVTGEQMWRHQRLDGKVSWVITDSPVLLGCIYGRSLTDTQRQAIKEWFSSLDNVNIFVQRSEVTPYKTSGRVHTYEEAVQADNEIYSELYKTEGETITFFDQDREGISELLEKIGVPLQNYKEESSPKGVSIVPPIDLQSCEYWTMLDRPGVLDDGYADSGCSGCDSGGDTSQSIRDVSQVTFECNL